MAEKKTKEQKYEDLLKAMQEGEMGMAKFLWDLCERVEGAADDSGSKLKETQERIDAFIKTFKDRKDGKPGKDGKTPTTDQLLALIRPLAKPGQDGKTPSRAELLDLIESVMPDPIPGEPGKPGKPGDRGPRGRVPKHEWNGTFIRFELEDGSFGEWKNLQGPPGEVMPGGGPSAGGGLERVRADGFIREGVTEIFFGDNLTVTRTGNGVRVDGEAGGSGSGGGLDFETPTGAVDDSNVDFTVTQVPLYLVVNGAQYFEGVHYTRSSLNITLNFPVGTGGFIRSAFGTGISIETPGGTVDDSNTTFTVTNEPKYVVVNGSQLFDGAGYTYSPGQIDLNFPVGENGFIRSVY